MMYKLRYFIAIGIAISFLNASVSAINCIEGQRLSKNGTEVVFNSTLASTQCNVSSHICLRLDAMVSASNIIEDGKNVAEIVKFC